MRGRIKTKDWKAATFSLEESTITKIETISKDKGIKKSELIDRLVAKATVNDIKQIDKDIELIELQITLKEKEIFTLKNDIVDKKNFRKKMIDWSQENSNKTLEAVEVIKKFLLLNKKSEAERYARGRNDINMEWIDLLLRARQELEVSGI